MPVHDWTRVDAGIFHDFHHAWIEEIKRALNRGLLPSSYYAMAEQIAGGLGPDVLALQGPSTNGLTGGGNAGDTGGVQLEVSAPRVQFRVQGERDLYALKAKTVKIRHVSGHAVVAVIEIISPGNKASRNAFRSFVLKALELLEAGVHLLLIDLFPPGPRDPRGIHDAVWQEYTGEGVFTPPAGTPLTLVSYRTGPIPEAFIQPIAVGTPLIDMPVFLTPDMYVPLPLEPTYQAAWAAVPSYWRNVIEGQN
jgi:hypothetical protein